MQQRQLNPTETNTNRKEFGEKILRVCLYTVYLCTIFEFLFYCFESYDITNNEDYQKKYGENLRSYNYYLYFDAFFTIISVFSVRFNYNNEDPQKAKKYVLLLLFSVFANMSMFAVYFLAFAKGKYDSRNYAFIVSHALVLIAQIPFFIYRKWEKVGNNNNTETTPTNNTNNEELSTPLNPQNPQFSMDPTDPSNDNQINYYRSFPSYPSADGQPAQQQTQNTSSNNAESTSDNEMNPYDKEDAKSINPYL